MFIDLFCFSSPLYYVIVCSNQIYRPVQTAPKASSTFSMILQRHVFALKTTLHILEITTDLVQKILNLIGLDVNAHVSHIQNASTGLLASLPMLERRDYAT